MARVCPPGQPKTLGEEKKSTGHLPDAFLRSIGRKHASPDAKYLKYSASRWDAKVLCISYTFETPPLYKWLNDPSMPLEDHVKRQVLPPLLFQSTD